MDHTARPRRPWEEGSGNVNSSPHLPQPSPPLGRPHTSHQRMHSFERAFSSHHSHHHHQVPLHHYPTPPLGTHASIQPTSAIAQLNPAHKRPRLDANQSSKRSHLGKQQSCCPPTCSGTQCRTLKDLALGINEEISTHEKLVHGDHLPNKEVAFTVSKTESLAHLLDTLCRRLKQSNASLQELLDIKNAQAGKPKTSPPPRVERPKSTGATHETKSSPPLPPHPTRLHSHRRVVSNAIPQPLSPVSLSIAMPATQHTYPSRPHSNPSSPSTSLAKPPSFSTATRHPASTSSDSTSAAALAHLHDLQHALSVKTLAYTTLRQEYDSLCAKLERQRIRSATLERKFEVSDAEIVSLSNDKERLEQQIDGLERQVALVTKSRDEAWQSGERSREQWSRIMNMAGKLHKDAPAEASSPPAATATSEPAAEKAEDAAAATEAAWRTERETLLKRIRELELGKTTIAAVEKPSSSAASSSATSTTGKTYLEAENKRLRDRNAKLEQGLAAAKQAALTLAVHGQNVSAVLGRALEDDTPF